MSHPAPPLRRTPTPTSPSMSMSSAPARAVVFTLGIFGIVSLGLGCGDPVASAKKALEEAGYSGIEVKKAESGPGVGFSGKKGAATCSGTVVMIRGMADIQANCSGSEQSEEAKAPTGPLAEADKKCAGGDGDAKACFELGRLLVEGPPGQRDLKRARTVQRDNCDKRKNLDSCDAYGYLHARAIGGTQDLAKAEALFTDACEKGHSGACANRGRLAFVDQRYKVAREMFTKSCDGKSQAGCNGLGTMLKQGKGGKEDMKTARKLFSDACDEDYQEACSNLGVMIAKGQGGRQDKEAGKMLLEKACKADVQVACHQIKKLGL